MHSEINKLQINLTTNTQHRDTVSRTPKVPLFSRKDAKLDRRCNAIFDTARIWAVNSSIIHPPLEQPTPSLDKSADVDFTTPRRRMVSLTYRRKIQLVTKRYKYSYNFFCVACCVPGNRTIIWIKKQIKTDGQPILSTQMGSKRNEKRRQNTQNYIFTRHTQIY